MIMDLEKNKLNLVVGGIETGKTSVIINTIKEAINDGLDTLYVTTDDKINTIEKRLTCVFNNKKFSDIPYNKETGEPECIILPREIDVIEDCNSIDDIKLIVREYSRYSEIKILVIDNINFLDDFSTDTYMDKIKNITESLDKYASSSEITIIASFNILKLFESKINDIDTKEIGNLVLLSRTGDKIDVYEDYSNSSMSYKLESNCSLTPLDIEEEEYSEYPFD